MVEAGKAPGSGRSDRAQPSADRATGDRWVLCRAATRLYAVPVEHVIEVMRLLPIEPVAGTPSYLPGLCVIRGVPVPVVDVGLLLGNEKVRCERLMTIRAGGARAPRTIALAIESVLGIRTIAAHSANELPPLLRDAATDAVAAIGTVDTELMLLLRAARIIPEDWLERLATEGTAA